MARGGGGWGGVEGYYPREAIILNIFVKGGDYSREAINRLTAIIQGNTVNQLKSLIHCFYAKQLRMKENCLRVNLFCSVATGFLCEFIIIDKLIHDLSNK